MSYFTVDILTPSAIIAKNVSADSVFVPTTKGQINLLPDHTHIIEKLDIGELITIDKASTKSFFVADGICKVLDSKITILAGACEAVDQIDRDRASKSLVECQKKLTGQDSLNDLDLEEFRNKSKRAEVRLTLSK